MDDLVANEHGCPCFEPNPFKQAQCKSCRSPWYQHKGVIDEELLRSYIESRRKASLDKQKKEDQEKRTLRAKKALKKRSSGAVEDSWLFDAAAEGNDEEAYTDSGDEDGDAGFKMLSERELDKSLATSERREATLKVVNLINFGECDLPEEEAALDPSQACEYPLSFESQLQEVEYLRQRLASVHEEKRLEMDILQEKVMAERAACGRLRAEAKATRRAAVAAVAASGGRQDPAAVVGDSGADTVSQLLETLVNDGERRLDMIAALADRVDEVTSERDEKELALQQARVRMEGLERELEAVGRNSSPAAKDRDTMAEIDSAVSWHDEAPILDGVSGSPMSMLAAVADGSPARALIVEISDLCMQSQRLLSDTVAKDLAVLAAGVSSASCGLDVVEPELRSFRDTAAALRDSAKSIGGQAGTILTRARGGGGSGDRGDCSWSPSKSAGMDAGNGGVSEDPAAAANGSKAILAQESAEGRAGRGERGLKACSRLGAAAGFAVAGLSAAGSSLQRVLSGDRSGDPRGPGADVAGLAADEDPIVQRTARCLLASLRSVSVALIDLAAALSLEIQQPLEGVLRSASASRAGKQAELDFLKQRRQVCTDAIQASLQRSQAIASGADGLGTQTIRSFFSKSAPASEAERLSLQQAEQRAIEEQRQQILALMQTEQVVTLALQEDLGRVDSIMRAALSGSLEQFPRAWVKIVDTMQHEIHSLRESA